MKIKISPSFLLIHELHRSLVEPQEGIQFIDCGLHEGIARQLPLEGSLLHVELLNLLPAQLKLRVQRLRLLQVLGQFVHIAVSVEVVDLIKKTYDRINVYYVNLQFEVQVRELKH